MPEKAMTPAPGDQVQKIQQRHDDFVAQYSPGPDWEPCNQMSKDRGWLLKRLRDVEHANRIQQLTAELDTQIDNIGTINRLSGLLAQAEQRVAQLQEAITFLFTPGPGIAVPEPYPEREEYEPSKKTWNLKLAKLRAALTPPPPAATEPSQ